MDINGTGDFDAQALPTRSAPPEARGLFLIFVT